MVPLRLGKARLARGGFGLVAKMGGSLMAIGCMVRLVGPFVVATLQAFALEEASCFRDLFALLSTHPPFFASLLVARSC